MSYLQCFTVTISINYLFAKRARVQLEVRSKGRGRHAYSTLIGTCVQTVVLSNILSDLDRLKIKVTNTHRIVIRKFFDKGKTLRLRMSLGEH
jgi:hypothetical protein